MPELTQEALAAVERDVTIIRLPGCSASVTRENDRFVWRVEPIDDAGTFGEANTAAEAWAAALALVPRGDATLPNQHQRKPLLAGANAAVRELWHAANLARAAQAFAENAILEPPDEGAERDGARYVVRDVLETLARDADAAAARLWDACSTAEGADHA